MSTMLRAIAGIIVAMIVALLLLSGVELFSAVVHPVPADFDGSIEQMCAHVARYPGWVLAVCLPMWAGIAIVSPWIAGKLGNRGAAIFIAFLLIAAVAFNVLKLPYPIWFKVACLITVPLASLAGVYFSGRRNSPAVQLAV